MIFGARHAAFGAWGMISPKEGSRNPEFGPQMEMRLILRFHLFIFMSHKDYFTPKGQSASLLDCCENSLGETPFSFLNCREKLAKLR